MDGHHAARVARDARSRSGLSCECRTASNLRSCRRRSPTALCSSRDTTPEPMGPTTKSLAFLSASHLPVQWDSHRRLRCRTPEHSNPGKSQAVAEAEFTATSGARRMWICVMTRANDETHRIVAW